MIASGEKKEEYRELKAYWYNRMCEFEIVLRKDEPSRREYGDFKKFDVVRFKNGYGKDAPTMDVEVEGIMIKGGREEWGAEPYRNYFVIKLGNIIN